MNSAEPRARWRDLAPRVGSALVMAPLGIASIWAGGVIWAVVLTGLSVITMFEWASVCGARPMTRLAQASAAALVTALIAYAVAATSPNLFEGWGLPPAVLAAMVPFVVILLMAFWLLPSRRVIALGMAYVGLGWASLLVLRQGQGGFGQILFIMIVVWADDIGAYLAGRLIGGPRLAPAISPGKTWAGSVGGLACGIGAGAVTALLLPGPHPGWPDAAAQAALLAVVAQAGDLLESALKRHYGKKDSGSLIPGHGGLLDRVDGLLGAAVAAMVLRVAFYAAQGSNPWQ
jgi:phosphatidate cytidylyltransferase